MIDPILSSTNPSPPQETNEVSEVKDSNSKLQQPKNEDTFLQAIPCFTKSQSTLSEPLSSLEPSLCEELKSSNSDLPAQHQEENIEPQFEYEFSCLFDGALCFVYLFDTSDVSACERVIHRPVRRDEIVYSDVSGNGFITDDMFRYTFTKEPYKRTWTTHADIKAGVEYENTVVRTQRKHIVSAEDILSSL